MDRAADRPGEAGDERPATSSPGHRARLAERVADLRQRGRERNVIIALVDQLQRDDAAYQGGFKKLYGPGLRSLASERLVSAATTDAFGPDD